MYILLVYTTRRSFPPKRYLNVGYVINKTVRLISQRAVDMRIHDDDEHITL